MFIHLSATGALFARPLRIAFSLFCAIILAVYFAHNGVLVHSAQRKIQSPFCPRADHPHGRHCADNRVQLVIVLNSKPYPTQHTTTIQPQILYQQIYQKQ